MWTARKCLLKKFFFVFKSGTIHHTDLYVPRPDHYISMCSLAAWPASFFLSNNPGFCAGQISSLMQPMRFRGSWIRLAPGKKHDWSKTLNRPINLGAIQFENGYVLVFWPMSQEKWFFKALWENLSPPPRILLGTTLSPTECNNIPCSPDFYWKLPKAIKGANLETKQHCGQQNRTHLRAWALHDIVHLWISNSTLVDFMWQEIIEFLNVEVCCLPNILTAIFL